MSHVRVKGSFAASVRLEGVPKTCENTTAGTRLMYMWRANERFLSQICWVLNQVLLEKWVKLAAKGHFESWDELRFGGSSLLVLAGNDGRRSFIHPRA